MRPIAEIGKRPVTVMSVEQLLGEGARIIRHFFAGGGTQFGCDWPTMWAVHPELCERFFALKAEYKSRGVGA